MTVNKLVRACTLFGVDFDAKRSKAFLKQNMIDCESWSMKLRRTKNIFEVLSETEENLDSERTM